MVLFYWECQLDLRLFNKPGVAGRECSIDLPGSWQDVMDAAVAAMRVGRPPLIPNTGYKGPRMGDEYIGLSFEEAFTLCLSNMGISLV